MKKHVDSFSNILMLVSLVSINYLIPVQISSTQSDLKVFDLLMKQLKSLSLDVAEDKSHLSPQAWRLRRASEEECTDFFARLDLFN
jgi:hypothetical protein